MKPNFSELHSRHNGELYLTPDDLTAAPVKLRRVLVTGSCFAELWLQKIECPSDFVLTNNLNELPLEPPSPVESYDFQLVQISMRRFILRDDAFWHASFHDLAYFERELESATAKMLQYLRMAMRWNKERGLLTFVLNFLVPQQNAMGRFAPRYDARNPVYFIEQLNYQMAKEIESCQNAYLLDLDGMSSVIGKRWIQDDTTDSQIHASLLGDSLYENDKKRIEPVEAPMTGHYILLRDQFISAVWQQAKAMYKSFRQEDSVKLVIVDLDNTLWRGTAAEGEEGPEGMIEGWPLGVIEALSYLKKRGVLLAIASQNDEQRITEMWSEIMRSRIELSDFAVVKIDWRPKAEKIEEILNLVNVLPSNTVFIDDNPVERAAVIAAYPDIRTLGQYPYYLKRTLLWSPETQSPIVSEESTRRTEMVQAQVGRELLRKQMSRSEFLESLGLSIYVTLVDSTAHPDFERFFELINKTNQFNTTGRRWSREECGACFKENWTIFVFKVKDRFTDYGLVGCVFLFGNIIEQFIMSCRVLGLDVEQKVIAAIVKATKENGFDTTIGRLIETTKNFPCQNLFEKCGFQKVGDDWVMV